MSLPKRFAVSPFLSLLLILSVTLSSVHAEATDPFAGASPAFDAAPADTTDYNVGDWGVSEQRGAATYTLPLDLPTGRNGMAPSLALRYSSQSALRGGLAVGWTFDVPTIQVDRAPGYEDGQTFYKAALGSASGRLVAVPHAQGVQSPYPNAQAYRAQFDSSFTRFYHNQPNEFQPGPAGWIALSPDGVRHYFEEESGATDFRTIWHITRQVDPFGNSVRYVWEVVRAPHNNLRVIDHRLQRIEYTANEQAGLEPHTKIEFVYADPAVCTESNVPIGAAPTPEGQARGASQLDAIQIYVRETPESAWQLRKELALTYLLRNSRLYEEQLEVAPAAVPIAPVDPIVAPGPVAPADPPGNDTVAPPDSSQQSGMACRQTFLRYLTQVDTTVYAPNGDATSLPPIKLQYNLRVNGPYLKTVPTPITGIPGRGPERELDVPGYAHQGTRRGATSALLDLNADGLLDHVSVVEENRVCTLVWQQGLFGGGFAAAVQKQPLPTAPWYHEMLDPPQPQQGLHALEDCNINGQVAYRPRDILGSQDPQPEKGMLAYRFVDYTGDGRVDLLTTIWAAMDHASYVPPLSSLGAAQAEDPVQAALVDPPPDNEPPGGPTPLAMTPEKSGLTFIWRVYRNVGDPDSIVLSGQSPAFSERFIRVTSRVALPPTVSDEKLDKAVIPNSILPPLFDIDGDGFQDVVDIGTHPNLIGWHTDGCDAIQDETPSWCVYFGNGGPDFSPGYDWPVPKVQLTQDNGGETTSQNGRKHKRQRTVAMLQDINGDGLPDLMIQDADNRLRAYLNQGDRFATSTIDLGRSDPLEEIQTDYYPLASDTLVDGNRGYRRRLVDLDQDGWLDMIYYVDLDADDAHNIDHEHKVYASFNTGDRFLPAVELPPEWNAAKRLFTADAGEWWIESGFSDLTGDGHADLANWITDERLEVVERPGLRGAPDRLVAVENGRGLRVQFRYAPATDPTVVDQDADNHLPRARWLVREVTIAGGHDTPPLIQRYHYADPAYRSAGEAYGYAEPARFLGFGQTTVTTYGQDSDQEEIRLRQVVKRFLYTRSVVEKGRRVLRVISPGGLLAEQWLYQDAGGQLQLHRYVQNEWQRLPLWNGLVHFVHRATSLARTCLPGSSTAQCMAQDAPVLRMQEQWTPVHQGQDLAAIDSNSSGNGPILLYVRTRSQRGSGLTQNATDRRTDVTYTIRYGQTGLDADDYRILQLRSEEQQAIANNGGDFETGGRTEHLFDPATGLAIETRRWHDAFTVATTRRTYDPQTGNLLTRTDPVQAAATGSGASTAFAYDAHHLFVQSTTNELGHEVHTFYDVATGALLERRGPNFVMLEGNPVWERETWRVDGLGRVLEHQIALDDAAAGYQLHLVEKTTYDDNAFIDSGEPVLIRSEQLRDFGGDLWVTSEVRLDGRGRPLVQTQLLDGALDAVTTYTYDAPGNLVAIESPDPRSDDGAMVRFTYTHDGLGRLTGFTRPDGTGVAVVHSGLDKTVQEVTTDGSGSARQEIYDVFGRLLELHELGAEEVSAAQGAVTRYGYDLHDNLAHIIDAEGNETHIEHDWVSNRTAIHRGDRAWAYVYDGNGNLDCEVAPVPAGESAVLYTVDYVYDDLDRVTAISYADMRTYDDPTPTPTPTNSLGTAPGPCHPSKLFKAFPFILAPAPAQTPDPTATPEENPQPDATPEESPQPDTTPDPQETSQPDPQATPEPSTTPEPGTTPAPSTTPEPATPTSDPTGEPQSGPAQGDHSVYLPAVMDGPGTARQVLAAGQPATGDPVYLPLVGNGAGAQTGHVASAAGQPTVGDPIYLPLVGNGAGVQTGLVASAPAVAASALPVAQGHITTTHYVYDEGHNGLGRLSRVELPVGEIHYRYDARGLIAEEECIVATDAPVALSISQSVQRTYNALGLPTLSVWDDGQQWRISYDERGLVDRVEWYDAASDSFQAVADYERALAGMPRLRTTSYDQTRSYSYDQLGRPTADTVTVNGNTIATRGYTYNEAGDLLSVSGATNGVSAAAAYAYDAQHRLLNASGPNGYSGDFTYSPTGNVLSADVAWSGSNPEGPDTRHVRYEYGSLDPQAVDRLVHLEGDQTYAAFTYDLSGNQVERSGPDGLMTLAWDGMDQLRRIIGPNGTETYFYDHTQTRILAVAEPADGAALPEPQAAARFWFAERETHFDAAGAQTRRYLHLAGAGPVLARVEESAQEGVRLELQYADALFNLMFALDEVGNLVASFLYGPFGEVLEAAGADEHRRQFNNKEHDAMSGLRYYGFRYYDPLTLRWASADPLYRFVPDLGLINPQRMNLYAFSLNNPVRYYDPDGRDPDDEEEYPICEPAEPGTCELDDPDDDAPAEEADTKEEKVDNESGYLFLKKDENGQPIKGSLSVGDYKGKADINKDGKNDSCVACLQSIASKEKVYNAKTGKWVKVPTTPKWKEGMDVKEAIKQGKIEPGTLIATFVKGKYPNKPTGNHAAVFVGARTDDKGKPYIVVFDSWSDRDGGPGYRPMYFGSNPNVDRSNNASSFSIVE